MKRLCVFDGSSVKPGDDEQTAMSPSDSISELKSIIRKDALMRRDALPAAERAKAAETIAARAFPVPIAAGQIVSGFMPLKTEINPLPLMRALRPGRAACTAGDRGTRQAAHLARLRVRR